MTSFSSLSTNLRDEIAPLVFTHRDPKALNPHPWNSAIYGEDEDEDVTELIGLIRISGWVKPLVVNPEGYIISGHRRCKAVLILGWQSVPVEVRQFPNETAELEALLLENASRIKTIEQKVREAEAWEKIEKIQAKQRQQQAAAITNKKLGRDSSKTLMENFPQASKGTIRDKIASRVGLGSGRTYAKAAKVVTQIDEEVRQGHLEIAQALRKVLNKQSVDAAHMLLKKTPQERQAIANLIVSGKAKSSFQARQILRQNNQRKLHNLFQAAESSFSVGDWITVNENAQSFKIYIGSKGQVEQLWGAEQQISVNLEGGPSKLRFYPHELTIVTKAAPPSEFRTGDIVFIDIDRQEATSTQEKKWNGFWGRVMQIAEIGSLTVDVGSQLLRLFPRDLKPINVYSSDLLDVVTQVLQLRHLELDEIEQRMLDVIQRREWFTPRQLDYLHLMNKFYLATDNPHEVISARKPEQVKRPLGAGCRV